MDYVKPGQHLKRIKAKQWNDILDCTEAWRQGKLSQKNSPFPISYGSDIIDVYNDTGSDIDILTVACIDTPIIVPDDDDYNLFMTGRPSFNIVSLSAYIDDEPLDFARFVVTREPIASEKIGKAIIYGCTPLFVDVSDENHLYAVPDPTNPNILLSWPYGPFRILWRSGGVGAQACFVSFPEMIFQNIADIDDPNFFEIDRSDPAHDALAWNPIANLPANWYTYSGVHLITENLRYRSGASATLEYIYQDYYWLTPFAPVITAVTPAAAATNICPNTA